MPDYLSVYTISPTNTHSRLPSRAKRGIRFIFKPLAILLALLPLECPSALAQTHPHRPRILGIYQVKISATHLPASLAFYSKTLNLANDLDRTLPSDTFVINSSQDLWLDAAASPTPANLIAEVTFSTDDVPAIRQYLVSQKIAVSAPIKSTFGDYYLTITDPEGHRIGFMQSKMGAAGSTPSAPNSSSASQYSSFRLIHAGFVVRDRTAGEHFYKDVLGFRPYWHGGMKDDQTDWVSLQVPDGTDWLEFMVNVSPNADHHTLGVMNHIALGVPDIQAAKAQLVKNGWKPTEEPKLGRDGKWQLNLYDPDDTRVELMEFTPKEKPCCSEFTGPHPGSASPPSALIKP